MIYTFIIQTFNQRYCQTDYFKISKIYNWILLKFTSIQKSKNNNLNINFN